MTRREWNALTQENHDGSPEWDPGQRLEYRHRRGNRWRLDILEQRIYARHARPGAAILAQGTYQRREAERALRFGLPLLTWPQSGGGLAAARASLPLPDARPVVEVSRAAA